MDFIISPVHPASAKVEYDVAGGPLEGVDLNVSSVAAIGTPLNAGAWQIGGGDFDFTTGDLISANSTWEFSKAGSSFSVVGTLDPGGNAIPISISGMFIRDVTVLNNSSTFQVIATGVLDEKNTELLDFFGAPINLYEGNFNLGFETDGPATPPDTFISSVAGGGNPGSGDLTNSPIPEPTSVMVWACLVCAVGLARRRRR